MYQNKTKVEKDSCCVLDKGEKKQDINHQFVSEKGAKFMLIAGQPLGEPIQQYGPFVMNSKEDIYKAFNDYQTGSNGFENADEWKSKIKDLMEGKNIEEL